MMHLAEYEYIITFVIYFLIIFIFCYYANKRTHNLSDFMLGNRALNAPIVALGAGASDMSGWLLLALPGAFFAYGFKQMWMPVGLLVGAYLNWRWVSPRLRAYTEIANNALTIPAYFDNRFRDSQRILRFVMALVILVFFTFYASAGFMSGALLFQATFHLSYQQALWGGAVFVIVYTAFGGFLAISWIDFFQGSLMFLALIFLPLYTIHHMGSWNVLVDRLFPIGEAYFNPWYGMTLVGFISLVSWGLGYFGQPHILVRFMAIRSVKELPTAWRICMLWMFITLIGAMATGIVGRAYFGHALVHQESVFLLLAKELLMPWLAGILLVAVLSAIMSTSSAQLLAASSAVIEDFYHRFFHRDASQSQLVLLSRLTVVVIALIAIFLARNPEGTVLELVSYAWGGLGASFGPVVLFSLFWVRVTKSGVLSGIVSGALTAILWKAFLFQLGGWWAIYEIVPGAIIASFAIVIVSLLSAPPSEAIKREFYQAKEAAKLK